MKLMSYGINDIEMGELGTIGEMENLVDLISY